MSVNLSKNAIQCSRVNERAHCGPAIHSTHMHTLAGEYLTADSGRTDRNIDFVLYLLIVLLIRMRNVFERL